MGLFTSFKRKSESQILGELKAFFTEFFGTSGHLILAREMQASHIERFTEATEELRINFVENMLSLIHPGSISVTRAKLLRAQLYTILEVSRHKQEEMDVKFPLEQSKPLPALNTIIAKLLEIFSQYFNGAAVLYLRREMDMRNLDSFDYLSDEQKISFIEDILENLFSGRVSPSKVRILRSELLQVLELSTSAKSIFGTRNLAGAEGSISRVI